uniref:NADH dehydrogenase subunit 6 n=1 Tax=Enicospilus sp. MD-2008 TaxID=576951 RepID=C4NCJ1_9HYME|nr:NADH dehydrogenase subunit 6 [Enicospilus sp. MD-2008]
MMMKSFLLLFNLFLLNLPMIMYFLMFLIIMMTMKYFNFHPFKFILLLSMFILFMSIYMNLLKNSWMMYLFPLMMIGGLMIMFMYIISLTSNKLFKINYNKIIMTYMKMSIFLLLWFFFNPKIYLPHQDLWQSNYLDEFSELKLNELFNFNMNSLLFITLYLFFTLIIIMNICYKMNNPLRQLYL